MTSLYDTDTFAWSEAQAAALRAMAARGVAPEVDWRNVAEGITAVGAEMLDDVRNAIRTILAQAIAGYCNPDTPMVAPRRSATLIAHHALQRRLTPSMRPHLDLDPLWGEAFDAAMQGFEPRLLGIPPSIPTRCPFTLDDLAGESFTYDGAVERLYTDLTSYRPSSARGSQP